MKKESESEYFCMSAVLPKKANDETPMMFDKKDIKLRSSLKHRDIKRVRIHESVENHERKISVVSLLVNRSVYLDDPAQRPTWDLHAAISHAVAVLKATCIAEIAKTGKLEDLCCLVIVSEVQLHGLASDV